MRIEAGLLNFNFNNFSSVSRVTSPSEPQNNNANFGSGVVVDISQAARDWAAKNSIDPSAKGDTQNSPNGEIGLSAAQGIEGCQTCQNRRYVDQSSDSSVSYQSPTHISPEQSAGKVMAHEREHISNDKASAEREDRRVVSQTVSLSTAVCPECGKMYVSGGTARTVTAGKKADEGASAAQAEQPAKSADNA